MQDLFKILSTQITVTAVVLQSLAVFLCCVMFSLDCLLLYCPGCWRDWAACLMVWSKPTHETWCLAAKWQAGIQSLLHFCLFCLLGLSSLQGYTRDLFVAAQSMPAKGHSRWRDTDQKKDPAALVNLECKQDVVCEIWALLKLVTLHGFQASQCDQTPWLPEPQGHGSKQGRL